MTNKHIRNAKGSHFDLDRERRTKSFPFLSVDNRGPLDDFSVPQLFNLNAVCRASLSIEGENGQGMKGAFVEPMMMGFMFKLVLKF